MSSELRAILFDLDQTLIVQRHDFAAICMQTAQAFRAELAPVSPKDFVEAFWPRAVDMWHMMVEGALPGDSSRHHAYRNTLRHLGADLALVEAMSQEGEKNWIHGNTLDENSIPVLTALRDAGYITGIITNGYTDIQWGKIRRHGLDAHVDFAIASEEAQSHKPDTGIFLTTLERLGVDAGEAMYVGDRLDNDVGGAKAAGMQGVMIGPEAEYIRQRAAHPHLPEPDARIRKLREVLGLVGVDAPEATQ